MHDRSHAALIAPPVERRSEGLGNGYQPTPVSVIERSTCWISPVDRQWGPHLRASSLVANRFVLNVSPDRVVLPSCDSRDSYPHGEHPEVIAKAIGEIGQDATPAGAKHPS